jgi:hypothetical protein
MPKVSLQLVLCYSVAEIRAIPHAEALRSEVILVPTRDRYLWNPSSVALDDGYNVLATSNVAGCVCCGGKGRWLRWEAPEGPPGIDGGDAFVDAQESEDTTSGTVSTGTSYPSWSAAILQHNVTVEVGDKVLCMFTGTATWAAGNDTTGIVVGISISGCPPRPVANFSTSGLGQALHPGLAGECLYPIGPGEEVETAGTYAVALHIARNGTNAMLAASAMRPIRLRTLVVRP